VKNHLVLSEAAAADILEQADWYSTHSGKPVAAGWQGAVTSAIMRVLQRPNAGTANSKPPNSMI